MGRVRTHSKVSETLTLLLYFLFELSFREIKCPTLFTTHYTELTELAAEQANGDIDGLLCIKSL